MQELPPGLAAGTPVDVRGETWRVTQVDRFEHCALVSLHGIGGANRGETLRVVAPFDRPCVCRGLRSLRVAGRHRCLRHAAAAIADAHPWRSLWTAGSAAIDLLPWQLEPALAVVAGATRVLLADAVGLGKTIQAGLILAELLARGLASRALVLTPAGLRAQWRDELRDRFRIEATELDQPALARTIASMPIGANPWATSPVVISSIDLVKRAEHGRAAEHVPFDVLIVDEAHHLTPGTERGAVVARLARVTPFVVLATATPHSGDERAYSFLRAIGSTRRDALTVFSRSGAGVIRRPPRRARLCAVRPTDAEAAMLRAVDAYARAIWRSRGAVDESARLVATVLARRAASSAAALARTLERRRVLTGGATAALQPALPWEEVDDRDDVEPEALLRVPGLTNAEEEARELDRLVALTASARAAASKPAWLERFVRRLGEPVVIFSEYRDTIDELARRFPRGDVALLHGGLTPAARRTAVEAFVAGTARVLLATDAAGEGLNLQSRCRTVVDVELPWNPVRLEQRVGRVDRLGQRRVVHALHLYHAGSIEDHVLARLHRRALKASPTGGGLSSVVGASAVRAVAECALGSGVEPALSAAVVESAAISTALAESSRLSMYRRLRALAQAPRARLDRHAWLSSVARSKRWRGATSVVCLFEATALDADGRLAARYVYPVAVAVEGLPRVTRRAARRLFAAIERHEGVRDVAMGEADACLRADAGTIAGASTRYRARIGELRTRLEAGFAPIQASLFDGRPARAMSEREERRRRRRSHLERREHAAAALGDLRLSGPPVLLAAWPHAAEWLTLLARTR